MICIGFGTNDKWTSRLIRWATRSQWSHTWIEYPSKVWGGRWAAHSWEDGVVKVPGERVDRSYPKRRVYGIDMDPGELSLGFDWARKHISAGYDYGVIWNGLLLMLWRATGWLWLWRVVARNASRFSCSEFVAGFLKAALVRGAINLDPETTTPGDLEEFCAGSVGFRVVE